MSTVTEPSSEPTTELSARPRSATGAGAPLRSELSRLLHRRLVLALLAAGAVALLVAFIALFATHGNDVAGARASAQTAYERNIVDTQQYREQCLNDPATPEGQEEAYCGSGVDPSLTPDSFYSDPRLRADQGLPSMAIAVTVVGSLLMALIGATGTGADWSSRTMVSLLTWQPRRLRFLGTRLGAIALLAAAAGVVAQALALGLTSLVVATRGTWAPTPPMPSGTYFGSGSGTAMIPASHFWRDLLSMQGRGVLLMVLAALAAAALATVTRSTGGFLGVALGWLIVVEAAGQALLLTWAPALVPWTLANSFAAAITPGGTSVYVGTEVVNGQMNGRSELVSNLEGLGHLGLLTVVVVLVAGLLLRRRDL
ncbi:MAG TPA: hypothetical protein VF661_12805 [Actinomycetales bacterium]|jgi:hypothetical protein